MIIRAEGDTLLLITQPDHAALAARIIEFWSTDGLPENPRRADILLAVRAHDDGWCEVDRAPLVDSATGRLQDFMSVAAATKQGVWPRAVEGLRERPYAAALVAHHALHVYDRFRSDVEWMPFFDEMVSLRDQYLARSASASRADLLRDYAFVRIGDLLSLTFCNAWSDAKTDEFGYVARLDGMTLRITPDPFDGQPVPLEITARQLPSRAFQSASDAGAVFERAPLRVLSGLLSQPSRKT
jgi:hypothetical protein